MSTTQSTTMTASLPVTATKTSGSATTEGQCCSRFIDELRHPAFHSQEVSGEVLHGPATFAPAGRWTLFGKTFLTLWAASTLLEGILDDYYANHRAFYLAYLTHWSLIITVTYLVTSWMQTVQSTTAKADATISPSITFPHKVTWALFALSAPAEVVVAIGYWGLEWDGTSEAFYYRNVMVHGVVILIVLVDGLLINKIPIRAGHFLLNATYFIMYFCWTLIHALSGIGNPTTPEEDDTLYTALQWKSDPISTLQTAGQMLFLLVPFAFLIVYGLSLYAWPCNFQGGSRRYLSNTTTTTAEGGMSYVEMNSVAQTV